MTYVLLIIFSFNLFIVSEKINNFYFKELDNKFVSIFIFSLFFVILYLISIYCFLLSINTYYISYFIFIASFLPIFFSKKYILDNYKNFQIFIIQNKLITWFLVFYFFISLLYPSDEDSLRYHLEIGRKINDGTFFNNIWLDYITLGAHEFLISMSLNINFEHFSSYTNFIYLFFAVLSNSYVFKKYKVGSGTLGSLIFLSSPYLIALVSSQKFYLFPCYVVTYSLAFLYLEKQIKHTITYLILILNIFCVVIKPIFIPYLVFILIWILIKEKSLNRKIIFVFNIVLISFLFYAPLLFIKYQIFKDPFLPFISINNLNYNWLSDFNLMLRGYNMDYTDKIDNIFLKTLLVPIKLIIPLQFGDLFRTLGVGIIFLISLNFRNNKNLFSLFLIFFTSVLVLMNFQSRWFLPLLIFISIFVEINKYKILNKLIYIQTTFLLTMLVPFGLLIFFTNVNIIKDNFLINHIFQANEVIRYVNKNYKNQKVFTNLNYFYYFNNPIPVYYPEIVVKFDKEFYSRNDQEKNLILWVTPEKISNNVEDKKLISFIENNFKCKKISILKDFDFYPDRFFLNTFSKEKQRVILIMVTC